MQQSFQNFRIGEILEEIKNFPTYIDLSFIYFTFRFLLQNIHKLLPGPSINLIYCGQRYMFKITLLATE